MIQSPQVLSLQPGIGDATDWSISNSGTFVGSWTDGLAGMASLGCQLRFLWGSGSGTVKVCVQSSVDLGNSAYDLAVANFAAASRTVLFQILASTSGLAVPGEGGLDGAGSPETEGVVASPVLGERLRLKVIVAGPYANTVLSARVIAA